MKNTDKGKLNKKILLFFTLTFIVIALMLFLPAGSFNYWQAWLFIGVIFTPAICVVSYFLKHDPAFLERRMRFKEKEVKQKTIIKVADSIFFLGFLIPGLDYRYGWSDVPLFVVILSDAIIFLAYMFTFWVFKENRYASRTLGVEKGQKVITTGPYAIVRHPMYMGQILIFSFMPLALGSYWALIAFITVPFIMIIRIFDEERLLVKKLKGYKEYMQKTKYRLIPKIW